MLFRFVERNDTDITEVATVDVLQDSITWKGKMAKAMKDLLANTKWRLLNDNTFDEDNPKHWEKLPKLLTGSRLWVESG